METPDLFDILRRSTFEEVDAELEAYELEVQMLSYAHPDNPPTIYQIYKRQKEIAESHHWTHYDVAEERLRRLNAGHIAWKE